MRAEAISKKQHGGLRNNTKPQNRRDYGKERHASKVSEGGILGTLLACTQVLVIHPWRRGDERTGDLGKSNCKVSA